jgi:hypothetical protein
MALCMVANEQISIPSDGKDCAVGIPASEGGVERLFSRGRDLLGLRRYALHPGTMKMLTILKASYSDNVFRKALVEISDEAIEDDIEVVIREPKM